MSNKHKAHTLYQDDRNLNLIRAIVNLEVSFNKSDRNLISEERSYNKINKSNLFRLPELIVEVLKEKR